MNSRERVIKSINHEEPDKVPIDFGGYQSGIHMIAYKKLLKFLEIEDPNIKFRDLGQQITQPCEEILQRFEVDTRYIKDHDNLQGINYNYDEKEGFIGFYDQFGTFWGNPNDFNDVFYYDPLIFPLKDMTTVEEIDSYDWPDATKPFSFEGYDLISKKMRESDYALVSPILGCVYEYTTFLFGLKRALLHLIRKPELIKSTMRNLLIYWKARVKYFIDTVGTNIDIILINGDLGDQGGPLMCPKMYRELIKPYEKQLPEYIHRITNAKINYHCCGSTITFLDHFAEIGYDAYNPVQVSAADMEPCSLKQRFGSKITFWGGLCNTQNTLPFGTPEKIRKEVKNNIECFKKGGGYIAANIHNITSEVPPENIVAMFDAAIEFRDY